jgi:hypothetical protein
VLLLMPRTPAEELPADVLVMVPRTATAFAAVDPLDPATPTPALDVPLTAVPLGEMPSTAVPAPFVLSIVPLSAAAPEAAEVWLAWTVTPFSRAPIGRCPFRCWWP